MSVPARGAVRRRAIATSTSLLVVFVGLFLALGVLYTAAANSAERLRDAGEERRDHHRDLQGTAVDVTGATWDANDNLTVRVTNTGDTTLAVSATDTVVDGAYVGISDYERVEVDGRDSDLWRPGEELVLEDADTVPPTPARVTVVTGPGVAGAAEVTAP